MLGDIIPEQPGDIIGIRIGITLAALRVWAHRGILVCDQSSDAAKIWIRLNPGDLDRLGGEANTAGMERVRDIAQRSGSSIASVWKRVREREFSAYRTQRGRNQWDWRLTTSTQAPAATSDFQLFSATRATA